MFNFIKRVSHVFICFINSWLRSRFNSNCCGNGRDKQYDEKMREFICLNNLILLSFLPPLSLHSVPSLLRFWWETKCYRRGQRAESGKGFRMVAIGLRKPIAMSESGTNLVVYTYDVHWLAMSTLITGWKYLEYISNIRIMHNNDHNWTKSIAKQLDNEHMTLTEWMPRQINAQSTVGYAVQRVKCTHIISWTIILISEKIKRAAKISWGNLLSAHGGYWTKPRGIALIVSAQIRRFSRW